MRDDTTSLRTFWECNARWYGHQAAFVHGSLRRSYVEVFERARKLGSALYTLGMRSQDRLSILAMNSDSYLEVYAAGECSGFIIATVNFRLAGPEVKYIVEDAAPTVLIFEAQYAGLVDSIRSQLSVKHYVSIGGETPPWATDYESLLMSGDADGAPLESPSPGDLAYIIYTSGTTGRPKGCMLDHASQIATARYMAQLLQMSPGTRTLLMMPFYHVGAKALQLGQNSIGGEVHIHRVFDVEVILRTVQAEKITHLHLAPVMVQSLIDHPKLGQYDLSSVQSILYAAAPMPEMVLRKALALLGPVFVQFWGQTEGIGTVLPTVAHRPDGDANERKRLVSIGHPFPGMRMRVVDEEDRDVPVGQYGELLVQGPVMMRGYWNKSADTVKALRGGWLHTGDICIADECGFLYLVDRKKDMIISGGENIYSREVEEAIASHAAVQECAVIGMPHRRWGEAVCAVVVKRAGMGPTPDELVAHCRTLIAGYKRPRYVIFTDSLPKLPSGKISKVELRKLFNSSDGLPEITGA